MPLPLTYSIRSIAVRKGSSAMAVCGIALVVIVLVVLLALAAGFRKAVASSGSPHNIIVLRKGSDAELQSQVTRETSRIISEMPIVAEDSNGEKLFVTESVVILARPKRDGGETNISVRGVPRNALKIHTEVKLQRGRWLTEGTEEAVIGVGLARRLEGFSLGNSISIGRHTWKIAGVFEADGSALESEMWMDVELLQNAFRRGNVYQSALFRAAGDSKAAISYLEQQIKDDPRLRSIQVQREDDYYRKQAKLMADLITILGGLLTGIMAIGAIVGAMNTMYAAVSQRKREIGCLLAMGFSPEAIWISFMFESLLLSMLGAIIGCGISMIFNGIKTGTTNWATFSETAFEFLITPEILILASVLALMMGFVGGVLPAFRAARLKVVDALRRA
jgi:putative ABC transport system permease protein